MIEAFDAVGEELAGLRVFDPVCGFGDALDFGASAFEVGADLFADEAADEAFEFDGGFVVGAAFAVSVVVCFADGAEAFEGAEALACGAFADLEAFDEVIEGERGTGDEEEAVDFADGLREAEHADTVHEDFDHLTFQRVEWFAGVFLHGIHRYGQ